MLSAVRDRRSFQRKIVVLSCALVAWLATAAPTSAAIINVIPSMENATVGDAITVGFYIENVTNLSEFNISFSFNGDVLAFVEGSVIPGDFLPAGEDTFFDAGFFEPAEPELAPLRFVRFVQAFLATGLTGDGLLFSASFVALAAGSGGIDAFVDPFVNYLADVNGADVPLEEVNNGTVTVSPRPTTVPEPGTLLLLSTGLAASVVASRRRKRRGSSLRD
jgi:hypothetical protein